jgi:hypothetical protein
MDARTVNNLPPAATHDGAARCLMAIELSKKSWIIGVNMRQYPAIGQNRQAHGERLEGAG